MYLYFDNSGTLKEIFTSNLTRQSASGWNTIHTYWDNSNGTITNAYVRYVLPDGTVSIQYNYNTKGNAQLPYERNHDVRFFQYFQDYYFYNFAIPDEILALEGPVMATVYYVVSDGYDTSVVPMGKFTFQVEGNASAGASFDDYVSISQWNYLIEKIGNIESGYLTGDHTFAGNIEFSQNIQVDGLSDLQGDVKLGAIAADILPKTTNTYKLGNTTYYWSEVHTKYLHTTLNISCGGTGYFPKLSVSTNGVISSLQPDTTDFYSLGSSSNRWNYIYAKNGNFKDVSASGDLSVSGTGSIYSLSVSQVSSNLVPSSTNTLGEKNGTWWSGAYADEIIATDIDVLGGDFTLHSGNGARIVGDMLPKTTLSYSIGSATYKWANLYVNAGYLDSLNVANSEVVVGTNSTTIKHLSVSTSMSVSAQPTFSNGIQVSGNLTDGTYSWTIQDVATILTLFGTDGDSFVNTINEVLDIFENYPEGADLVSVLATKFDKADILTSYSDTTSNTTVYSSAVVKGAIDTILGYFDSNGIAKKALADENGDNIYTNYMKYNDLDISGGVVVAINNVPVASEVNVNGQPIPVSSTDDMTDTTKMYWLTTDGYIYYYDGNDWVQTSQKLFDTSSDLVPSSNGTYNIGSSSYKWNNGYFVGSLYALQFNGSQLQIGSYLEISDGVYFNSGLSATSINLSGNLTDGTYSISVEEIVNDKANVEDLENGTLIPSKSLSAKAIENVSEESGTIQESPFINQGTGTANNTDIVDTSPVGKQLEKQGNTIVYNQLSNITTFAETTVNDVVYKVVDSVITMSGTSSGAIYNSLGTVKLIANHKYLFAGYHMMLFLNNSNALGQDVQNDYIISTCNTTGTYNYQLDIRNNVSVNKSQRLFVIDLTQWFNGDIPQDLLDNPSHWSWYYNGSLDYNVGELRNCAGRYLVCGGRNVWDEEWKNGYYDTSTGVYVYQSTTICSKNNILVVPSKQYFVHFTGNATYINIQEMDVSGNFLRNRQPSKDSVYTPSSDARQISFFLPSAYGDTYNNDITISLYYTTGDGYNEHYAYESPKVYDTGTETLRRIPVANGDDIFDSKLPSGAITRRIGIIDLGTLGFTLRSGKTNTFQVTLSDILPTPNDNTIPNWCMVSKIYGFNTTNNVLSDNYNNVIAINTNKLLLVRNTSYSDATTFTTAMSGVYLIYELATPTTEQGTAFSENIEINDYGTMLWQDTSNNLVAIPQGTKLFYPADYVLLIDSLNTYVNGDVTKLLSKSMTQAQFDTAMNSFGYYKQEDLSSQITLATGVISTIKKAYKIGNQVSMTLVLRNSTGSAIASGTTIATLGNDLKSSSISYVFYVDVAGSSQRLVISHINNNISLGTSWANDTVAYISISYAVA